MSDPLQNQIAAAISRLGLRETARRLGVAESSVLRLSQGCTVRPTTRSLAGLHVGLLIEERMPDGVRFE